MAKSQWLYPKSDWRVGKFTTSTEMYQEVGKINSRTSLTPEEIEVVQITAAAHNGCDFCVAGHTKIGTLKLKMPEAVLNALRARTTIEDNAKYQALAQFTMQLIDQRGKVSDDCRTSASYS